MDLNRELEKVNPKLNVNQKSFIGSCRVVLDEIDKSKVATGSEVIVDGEILTIKLIHKLDPDTAILFNVDKFEIFIVCAGVGDSMFFQFPLARGEAFYNCVKNYVRSVLDGDYIKELYTNSKGEYVKGVLKWKDGKFKESIFMSLGYRLKSLLFRERYKKGNLVILVSCSYQRQWVMIRVIVILNGIRQSDKVSQPIGSTLLTLQQANNE